MVRVGQNYKNDKANIRMTPILVKWYQIIGSAITNTWKDPINFLCERVRNSSTKTTGNTKIY